MDPWEKLSEWCKEHAPRTYLEILPPRPQEELEATQNGTGLIRWPKDVTNFYQWCNGIEQTGGFLLPGWSPLPLGEVLSVWELYMDIAYSELFAGEQPPSKDAPDARASFYNEIAYRARAADSGFTDTIGILGQKSMEAGELVAGFIPEFLPIAEDQSGSYLMADRRGGDLFGRIVEYDKVDADINASSWKSLHELIEETYQACLTGQAVKNTRWAPRGLDGELDWNLIPRST